MDENYICFLPNGNIINNTLRLTNLQKDILSVELICSDFYNGIVEFTPNGNMIVVAGSKANDKRAKLFKQLSDMFGGASMEELKVLLPDEEFS
jgi:hypothetical protein